jgi:hypothetical protein
MKAVAVLLFSLMLMSAQFAHSYVEEKNVEFTLSPALLHDGEIQIAFEWITPANFRKKDLMMMDLQKIHSSHADNNQMIISKLAFTTKQSFDSLSYAKMNSSKYITDMLNSVGITKKASDTWYVTNKVRAYSIPFKVSFDFKFREVSADSFDENLLRFIRDENSAFAGAGRERYLILDMTNFTQLMYRNYSVVYMKELSPNETLIYSGVVAGLDLKAANSFFNYPPFATTKATMMGNLRTQILHMARSIQDI